MALVFKTKKDDTQVVEIAGVGQLGAAGLGGVPVEEAAKKMVELQDDGGRPLSGSALSGAARRWAESRGITVEDVSERKLAQLATEAGGPPPVQPVDASGRELYDRFFGGEEATAPQGAAPAVPPETVAEDPAPTPTTSSARTSTTQQEG